MFVENAVNEDLLETNDIDKMVKALTTLKELIRKDNMVIQLFI
jgi:hypothetical protein